MLVSKIIGKCPGCQKDSSFGNVSVSQNMLLRGCTHCEYSEKIPLPELSKKVIYLDQFFLSHSFRTELNEFVDVSKVLSTLADEQLVVCPYSFTHEIETLQWRHAQRDSLFEFIKHTSRGHRFLPEYKVKGIQISRAFKQFVENDRTEFAVNSRDALPDEINSWDDYFRVDINRYPENIELTRQLKEQSVEELVNLFPKWRQSNKTFEEDFQTELSAAAKEKIGLILLNT